MMKSLKYQNLIPEALLGYTWDTPKWEAAADFIGKGIDRALKGASGR